MNNGKALIKVILGITLMVTGICGLVFFGLCTVFGCTVPIEDGLKVRIAAIFVFLLIDALFFGVFLLGKKCLGWSKKQVSDKDRSGKTCVVRIRCDGCGAHVKVEKGQWTRCDHCGKKIRG